MKITKIVNNKYEIVKIKTSYSKQYVINNLKFLQIINQNKLDNFINSKSFDRLIYKENIIRKHPFFIKKILETNDSITIKAINISHSPNNIKINQEIVTKTQVASYWKNGNEKLQYLINASCIIKLSKKEYNEMIQNVSTDIDVIKELGGQENIKRIQQKLENEWDEKPSYDYMDYLKTTIIEYFEKYEKDYNYIENTIIKKPDEE